MVALKHRHFGALLAICALVLSFFGVTQVVSASLPARAGLSSTGDECERQGHIGLGQGSAR